MNMETGELYNGTEKDFQAQMDRGVLVPVDDPRDCKEIKHVMQSQYDKNKAKARRKALKNKRVRS